MKTTPSTIALVLLILSVLAYAGIVSPMSAALITARTRLSDEESRLTGAELAIAGRTDVKTRLAVLEAENAKLRSTWLTPMLNSYAMRAKSLLDVAATEAGLGNVDYNEGAFRALPIPPGAMPERRTARQSVRIRATADYAALVSFLLRAERDFPLLALQALTVKPTEAAECQEAEITLEWPCEGKVIR